MSNNRAHSGLAGDATPLVIANKVNRLLRGEINCTFLSFTLNAGATTTTLTDPRIQANSFIDFMPTTANAATAKTSIWITPTINKGSCTVNHANSANVDQTFTVLIIG